MMVYGYARVSSKEQNLDRQIKSLHDFGIEDKYIITDKQSGKDFHRKGFNLLVGTTEAAPMLRHGDLLVVDSIDRIGRNYEEIRRMWSVITKDISADIKILDMPLLDTRVTENSLDQKFISDLVLQILSYCAEKERKNIRERQRQGYEAMDVDMKGRKVSKKTGGHVGRKEIPEPDNFDTVYKQWKAGEITAVQAMKLTGLKKNTFYRMAAQQKV